MRHVLAADFGGTSLRAAVVSEDGGIAVRREIDTPEGPAGLLDPVLHLLSSTAAEWSEPLAAACIASAGLIDATGGRIIISPNIPGFRNLVLVQPVGERLGIPTFIENDASAAALGEFRYGAARGFNHVLHVTAGTDIGGGLVLGGRLYRGARGFAGEIGHMVIDAGGPPCSCGARGCVESLVSGTAFARRARRLVESGRSPALAAIVGEQDPTGEHLYTAAIQGDTLSEAEIRNGGHYLGLALGSLMNILNPEAVTISGGLVAMGDMLFGSMHNAIREMAYSPTSGVTIRFSELGDDAGLLGAAAVALEHLDS